MHICAIRCWSQMHCYSGEPFRCLNTLLVLRETYLKLFFCFECTSLQPRFISTGFLASWNRNNIIARLYRSMRNVCLRSKSRLSPRLLKILGRKDTGNLSPLKFYDRHQKAPPLTLYYSSARPYRSAGNLAVVNLDSFVPMAISINQLNT